MRLVGADFWDECFLFEFRTGIDFTIKQASSDIGQGDGRASGMLPPCREQVAISGLSASWVQGDWVMHWYSICIAQAGGLIVW